MTDARPPLVAELLWAEELRFGATSGSAAIVVDADGAAGPSPMQLAAFGFAGCMASDVAEIRITLHFHVSGAVPSDAVDRAITLSREKFCSVWHSMRPDIAFTTAFDIHP